MIFTLYGPEEAVAALTQLLKDQFQLSEAGVLHYLLGTQISITNEGNISLSQKVHRQNFA